MNLAQINSIYLIYIWGVLLAIFALVAVYVATKGNQQTISRVHK